MPKQDTDTLSVYSESIEFWQQEDSYGFTYDDVDYGIAVVGMSQDVPSQVASALFSKLTEVLGKTPQEYETARGEITSVIAPWIPTATPTTPVEESVLTSELLAAIQAAITDGSLPIILTSPDTTQFELTVSDVGAITTTEL